MTLQRWDPLTELRRLEEFTDRLWAPLSRLRGTGDGDGEAWGIPLDVVEQNEDLVVRASVPGIEPADVKVNIEDGVLTIRAETRQETEKAGSQYLMKERRSGSFFRALRLPNTIDQDRVSSTYNNGVLTVNLPKSEVSKAREIKVKVA